MTDRERKGPRRGQSASTGATCEGKGSRSAPLAREFCTKYTYGYDKSCFARAVAGGQHALVVTHLAFVRPTFVPIGFPCPYTVDVFASAQRNLNIRKINYARKFDGLDSLTEAAGKLACRSHWRRRDASPASFERVLIELTFCRSEGVGRAGAGRIWVLLHYFMAFRDTSLSLTKSGF